MCLRSKSFGFLIWETFIEYKPPLSPVYSETGHTSADKTQRFYFLLICPGVATGALHMTMHYTSVLHVAHLHGRSKVCILLKLTWHHSGYNLTSVLFAASSTLHVRGKHDWGERAKAEKSSVCLDATHDSDVVVMMLINPSAFHDQVVFIYSYLRIFFSQWSYLACVLPVWEQRCKKKTT